MFLIEKKNFFQVNDYVFNEIIRSYFLFWNKILSGWESDTGAFVFYTSHCLQGIIINFISSQISNSKNQFVKDVPYK